MSSGTGSFSDFVGITWCRGVLYLNYHIIYEAEKRKKGKGSGLRRLFLTTGFFLCFLWLVGTFWPDGQDLMKQLLIPGDPDITLEAAEVFAQEVGSGFAMADAARNFCLAVLNHGYTG